MIPKSKQIEFNIKMMNFDMIQSVISFLKITWIDTDSKEKKTPSVQDLTSAAEFCMIQACESENKIFSYGGFESEIIEDVVFIKFILDHANPLEIIMH